MKNVNSIISRLSHSGLLSKRSRGVSTGLFNNLMTHAIIGKQTGATLNPNSQKKGTMAAVGGMAWKAYQVYSQQSYGHRNTSLQKGNLQRAYQLGVYSQRRAKQHDAPKVPQATSVPSPKGESRYIPSSTNQPLTYSPATLSKRQFEQVVEDESQDIGQMLILRAMITAANADGHIDEHERQQIYQQVDNFDLSTQDKARLFDEIRQPLSLQGLVKSVPNEQTAIEVFAASIMAIDEQQPASQKYLIQLADSLSIPAELVTAVYAQAEQMS